MCELNFELVHVESELSQHWVGGIITVVILYLLKEYWISWSKHRRKRSRNKRCYESSCKITQSLRRSRNKRCHESSCKITQSSTLNCLKLLNEMLT